jgi:hypothetical protein
MTTTPNTDCDDEDDVEGGGNGPDDVSSIVWAFFIRYVFLIISVVFFINKIISLQFTYDNLRGTVTTTTATNDSTTTTLSSSITTPSRRVTDHERQHDDNNAKLPHHWTVTTTTTPSRHITGR